MRNRVLLITGTVMALGGALVVARPALAHGGFGLWGGDRGEKLADALGVTVDELQAAQEKAHAAALDEAVDAGRITREDADLRLARMAVARDFEPDAALASALGVTGAELEEARAEGTLRDLAEEKELDRAAVQTAMATAWSAAVDAALDAGTISAEQAETLRETGAMGHCMGKGMFGAGGFRMHRDGGVGTGRHRFQAPGAAGGARFGAPRTLPGSDV